MKKKCNFLTFLFLFLAFSIYSQNSGSKWTFGVALSSVQYSEEDVRNSLIKGKFISQSPRFSLAKYMFPGVTFVGSVSTAIGDNQDYTTFDGVARYDFKTSQNSTVPYVLIGGSFVKAFSLTPTMNIGAGSTFWFSDKYGVNIQAMYKVSQEKFVSQRSHLMTSIGLVYSFKGRNTNPRIWDICR